MFEKACAVAREYTRPAIVLTRMESGEVGTGVGTFIILNSEGWILTAAHMVEPLLKLQRDSVSKNAYLRRKAEIEADSSLSPGKKRNRINQLQHDRQWLTNVSLVFGPGAANMNVRANGAADLAVMQVPSLANRSMAFPVFGDPKNEIKPGASLCRMGFPFHNIEGVTFDAATQTFRVPQMPALAVFPNEGIYTRDQLAIHLPQGVNVTPGQVPANAVQVRNIETSSPGLRGQSGGPIFDRQGRVWAIQSRTMSLPLGISCKVKDGSREIVEHQFMHVGVGPHVSHIRQFLDEAGVKYHKAEDAANTQ